ncbi:MAG: response regulator [Thermodesulfobacteriota bacterium]
MAEDDEVNQALAVTVLEQAGWLVTAVANGQEALAALEAQGFDLVLMDLQMPVMDGLAAVHRLRQREKVAGGHLPVVAMTAHAMKGDRERCLAAGMDDYLAKPIGIADLVAMVRRYLPPQAQ